jgi:hypothetical protein
MYCTYVYSIVRLHVTFPNLQIKAAGPSETLVYTRLLDSTSQKNITLAYVFFKPLTPWQT